MQKLYTARQVYMKKKKANLTQDKDCFILLKVGHIQ